MFVLNRPPFCAVARPLVGAALGLVAGGLYGALCGGLYAVIEATPAVFVGWLVLAARAGALAGFLIGVCSVADRASWAAGPPREPQRRPHVVPPRTPVRDRSRQAAGPGRPVYSSPSVE